MYGSEILNSDKIVYSVAEREILSISFFCFFINNWHGWGRIEWYLGNRCILAALMAYPQLLTILPGIGCWTSRVKWSILSTCMMKNLLYVTLKYTTYRLYECHFRKRCQIWIPITFSRSWKWEPHQVCWF